MTPQACQEPLNPNPTSCICRCLSNHYCLGNQGAGLACECSRASVGLCTPTRLLQCPAHIPDLHPMHMLCYMLCSSGLPHQASS